MYCCKDFDALIIPLYLNVFSLVNIHYHFPIITPLFLFNSRYSMNVLYILKNIIILVCHIFPVLYMGASIFTSDTHRAPSHCNKERDGSNKSNPANKK